MCQKIIPLGYARHLLDKGSGWKGFENAHLQCADQIHENFAKSGKKPPFAVISVGKCFRNEATDATHEMQFYQIEGLMIGENISMANLKGVLSHFIKNARKWYQSPFSTEFLSFTEPSIEFDLKYKGRWIEMGGAGMVHPKVLENCGIDPNKYQGFAFGPGWKD